MAGKIITYTDVPQASFRTLQLDKPAIGVLCENNTNVTVSILNDLGKSIMECPPGLTLGWNEPGGMYSPQVGCVGSYQGNARVYFYDGLIDVSNNPAQKQPPGDVTISAGTVTISGGNVIVTQMPPVDLKPGNTIGLIPGTGINVNNDITDPVARSYLAALQGLLPQSLTSFTFPGGWSEQTKTLGNAVTTFSVCVFPPYYTAGQATRHYDGQLWVWYEVSGVRLYVENGTYWPVSRQPAQTPTNPTWLHYDDYVPASGKIGVGYDGEGVIVLRS